MAPGTTSDMRNGMVMRYSGDLYQVVEWQHINPGKGRAFVRVKLKGLTNGSVIEERLRSGESIDIVRIESRPMQFLYRDGDTLVFMDNETFEQLPIPADMVGDKAQFLKDNETVQFIYDDETETLLNVELPTFVTLTVVETVTAVRGDTATDVSKPATLETGAVISVPGFINEGDALKIDTRTGEYMERSRE
jgi:elongation factor P